MDFKKVIKALVWYGLLIPLRTSVEGNNVKVNESVAPDLLHVCVGLSDSQIELCNDVEVDYDITKGDEYCTVEDCRKACCANINKCYNEKYTYNGRVSCIENDLNRRYGSCCRMKHRKNIKSK